MKLIDEEKLIARIEPNDSVAKVGINRGRDFLYVIGEGENTIYSATRLGSNKISTPYFLLSRYDGDRKDFKDEEWMPFREATLPSDEE